MIPTDSSTWARLIRRRITASKTPLRSIVGAREALGRYRDNFAASGVIVTKQEEVAAMSESNERQRRAIENLATALNECFDAAVERSTHAAERNWREVSVRLDRQDDTLRMIWTQCGGRASERLPIDG